MSRRNLVALIVLLLLLTLPVAPSAGQDSSGLIDDFETGNFDDRWWFYTEGSEFNCDFAEPGYESQHALHLAFAIAVDVWPGCGIGFADASAWPTAEGLSFIWKSDQPGLGITLILTVIDPTQTNPDSTGFTPFQIILETPGDQWTWVTLPWNDFVKADWVGATGATILDPTQVSDMIFQATPGQQGEVWIDNLRLIGAYTPPAIEYDKFALWTEGTQLRGANIWLRIVVPAVDGDEFLGSDHVGPPFTQADFDRLAALGANYVNISGPGLFTEIPPYVLDEAAQANLDKLLTMIARADLFAVITFRTGPGRSDFTFYDENIEEWGDPSLVIDDVWTDQAAQIAWAEMWQYTADRYQDNPIVVGYDLMCEPNAAGRLLEIWNPEDFYPTYAGTLYDWNQVYPRIVDAIRQVDPETPILIGAAGWSAVSWLPYLAPVDDARVVYMVHQYEPQEQYTHQEPGGTNTYPGLFDLNWDDVPDPFDQTWLNEYLSIIDDFQAEYSVPVAVNEYGIARWIPGAAAFMSDEMYLFEQRDLNHAFWAFNPAWPPYAENDGFNWLHGADPNNHTDVETSDLIEAIRINWSRNTVRPSNVGQ